MSTGHNAKKLRFISYIFLKATFAKKNLQIQKF
jgi:hypothetical protein